MSEVLLLAGRYEILSLLGTGGMGAVYRAHDRELDEVVALKMLRQELAASPDMVGRFRLEAKLARRVTHPNVARTFDIGEHDGGKFLTMEFIDGESLGAKFEREGKYSLQSVIELAEAICAGLSAAHAAGVVHRDLKPDNVILGKDGSIKITDFGIARALAAAGGPEKTMGVALGTPAYMAPEQVEGASSIDARADLYALGAMLFELVTGQLPWQGNSIFAIASARLIAAPPDPRTIQPGVPDALARIIRRCMALLPSDRYASADEVAQALAAITLPFDRTTSVAVPTAVRVDRAVEKTEVRVKTVAVIPFRNLGAASDQHFVEGFTDDLIDMLSMTQGLRTRPRSSVAHLRGVEKDPREIGRELNVHVVVEGSFAKIEDNIQARIRLTTVEDGFQLWAKRFDRPATALFEIGEEAAAAIANALAVGRATPIPSHNAPLDPRALDLYLRARQQYRSDSRTALDTVKLFEEALLLAPGNPMILSGYALAVGRAVNVGVCDRAEADRACIVAEQAIAAAPHLPEARMALARLRYDQGDYASAASHVRDAAAIAPNHGDAHAFWGRLLIDLGVLEGGIHRCRVALALDPGLFLARADLVRAHSFRGEWDEADALVANAPAGNVSSNAVFHARSVLWRRDKVAAAIVLENAEASPVVRDVVIAMARVTIAGKLTADEQAAFDKMMKVGPAAQSLDLQLRCELSAALGQYDVAILAIQSAEAKLLIDVAWLDHCPLFEPLRRDPRFVSVRASVAARGARVIPILEAATRA